KIKFRSATFCRLLIVAAEFAGKQSAGKRAPYEQSSFGVFHQRHEFALQITSCDGIVGLKRIEARPVLEFRYVKRSLQSPGRPVRATHVTNFPLINQRVESSQRFLNSSGEITGMNLIEIDVVCLQPSQARIHRLQYVFSRGTNVVVTWPD